MADTTTTGPVLRLPIDMVRLAEAVAHEFAGHEAHVRDRTLAERAEALRERARLLRDHHTPDPLVEALRRRCHAEGGAIHAAASVVAAVALEAIAAQLDPGEETPHGHA